MLLKITNYFWGIILLILIVLSINWAFISTDAPYYLSVARDISRGNIPYKDIYLSYTPVMMYLNSIIHILFNNPSYFLFLGFQYMVMAISAGLIFDFSYKENKNIKISIFLSLLFFISVMASDGTYINLEVYVILFVLLAYWLLQKKQFFLCGLVLALSFFSKQYGVLNFLPFTLLIVGYHGLKWNYLVKFLGGGLLPLILFLIYFVFLKEVSFIDLALQLTGSGYDGEMMELETTWFRFLAGAKIFLLLLIPLVFVLMGNFWDRINIFLIIGLIVSLLPLYVVTVSHYFLLCFPYIFLLMVRNLEISDKRFFLVSNISLLIIAGLLFARINRYKGVYEEQLELASETRKEYSVGSEVFLYKHFRFLYILNDYQNPVLEEVGYRYGFEPDEEFKKKYNVMAR